MKSVVASSSLTRRVTIFLAYASGYHSSSLTRGLPFAICRPKRLKNVGLKAKADYPNRFVSKSITGTTVPTAVAIPATSSSATSTTASTATSTAVSATVATALIAITIALVAVAIVTA